MKGTSKKKILQSNVPEFFDDLKKSSEIMVFTGKTRHFFKIRKIELLESAERSEIRYYLTDEIFKVKRTVMVII